MKKIFTIAVFTIPLSLISCFCSAQIITTVVGNGVGGYYGDGGQATDAELNGPNATLIDGGRNIYVCDQQGNRVRLINRAGVISTYAGNGIGGFSGDGGPATAAEFNEPTVINADSAGNHYVVDFNNNRIRKIDTAGIVTTVAGNGSQSYSGNGGAATAAALFWPCCVITDDTGNLYIADSWNNVIRKVNTAGIINLFAGNQVGGFSGDNGNALAAELNKPFRIAFDRNWNMLVADCFNDRIREINTAGIITTIAGNGMASYSGDGGAASDAELNNPYGVCIDASGNIYIADTQNNRIRVINSSGTISTVAGVGMSGYSGDGGAAIAAEVNGPTGVSLGYAGNLYIADINNNRVREVIINSDELSVKDISMDKGTPVYPNPSNGIFTFQLPIATQSVVSIEIYNTLGEIVKSEELRAKSTEIDLSAQPNGVYLYRVLGESDELIGKGKLLINK